MSIIDFLKEFYQLRVISQNPSYISEISNPSEKVQMASIKKDLGCITLIDKPCEAAQIYAVERDPFVVSLIPPSETALMVAVTKMPEVLLDVPNPSPELYQAALNTAFPGLTTNDISPEEFKELLPKLKAASNVDERKKIIATFRSAALQRTQTYIEAIQILQGNAPAQILNRKFELVRDQFPYEEYEIQHAINDEETGITYSEPRMLSNEHSAKTSIQRSAQSFANEIKKTLSSEELLKYAKELDSTSNLPLGKTPTIEKTLSFFSNPYTQKEFVSAVFENEEAGRYELQSPTIQYKGEELLHAGTHPYSPNYKDVFEKAGLKDKFEVFEKACCERSHWDYSYNYAMQTRDIAEMGDLERKLSGLDEKVENSRSTLYNELNLALEKGQISSGNPSKQRIELCSTSSRLLSADVVIDGERKITAVSNPMITNKLTGGVSPLDTKGIDLKGLSGSQMKNLLSGQQLSGISGLAGSLGLSKTPAGWCLSIGKKIVNTADSEAGI